PARGALGHEARSLQGWRNRVSRCIESHAPRRIGRLPVLCYVYDDRWCRIELTHHDRKPSSAERCRMSYREVSEIRDGMQIDCDIPIEMDDGIILRADVYRPITKGRHPVLLSYGPYGKWLHFEDGYESAWRRMIEKHPDVAAGATNKYQNWEVVDPETWVPD